MGLGDHFHIANPVPGATGLSPVWDFRTAVKKDDPNGYITAKEAGVRIIHRIDMISSELITDYLRLWIRLLAPPISNGCAWITLVANLADRWLVLS